MGGRRCLRGRGEREIYHARVTCFFLRKFGRIWSNCTFLVEFVHFCANLFQSAQFMFEFVPVAHLWLEFVHFCANLFQSAQIMFEFVQIAHFCANMFQLRILNWNALEFAQFYVGSGLAFLLL